MDSTRKQWIRGVCVLQTSLVAFGVMSLPSHAAGTDDSADSSELEEVEVIGLQAAERKALESKRNADVISEALQADDVGKLPDQNVAEAVKRLTGVTVANDQGEGRYVIIRGINPALANITVNGRTAPVPEPESRQIKLDDIPSALVDKVEVIKSLTPDRDANAIAGQVDIDTLSAFDKNRFFGNARLYAGKYELDGKHPVGGDATLGDVFGADNQLGVVLAANYDRRPIESENTQGSSNWRTVNGFVVPDDFRIRDYNLVRKRSGYVANLDWRLSDTVKLHWRNMYSEFSDDERRDQARFEIGTAITGQTASSGTFNTRATRFVRRRREDDSTWSSSLGGDFSVAGGVLSAEATAAVATKKDPLRSEWSFRSANNAFSASYDLSRDPFVVTPSATAYDATLYPVYQVNYDTREARDSLQQYTLDYRHPLMNDDSYFKVGAKYLTRNKRNDRDYAQYTASGFNLSAVSYTGGYATFDGRYVVGPRIDYDAAQAYVASHSGSLTLTSSSRVNNNANDYRVGEDVTAAYLMAGLRFAKLTVIPGVRVERTQGDFRAKIITSSSPQSIDFNTFGSNSYTDWFPGVNLRYDFAQQLIARAAVTSSIGRPNFADLPPYLSVDSSANTVTRGNPDLEPLKSLNIDAAIEYYLSEQGVLSLGVFEKRIDDPIYTETVAQSGSFGGINLTNAQVTTPRNARKATVKGVELNAQTQFGFLPGMWSGFGVGANFTVVDSDESGLAGRSDSIRMSMQSDHVATFQAIYEKYGVTVRVAYSYRSAYLDTVGAAPSTDIYTDKNGQWDAHLGYAFTKNFNLFLEGANLNDEPWRRYIGQRNQLVEIEHYGWSARLGAQAKF